MILYRHLFYAEFTNQLLVPEQEVKRILEVELALVNAQERVGIIPAGTENKLVRIFQDLSIDFDQLSQSIPLSGNAAAALLKEVVKQIKSVDPSVVGYIHLGATSQDIVDTATVLKIKAYHTWLAELLLQLERTLSTLSREHASTAMIGRTLMQQARPITFGLKTAQWFQGVRASKELLDFALQRLLSIQLGGAVGSGNEYLTASVRAHFSKSLGLKDGPSWHTERSRITSYASALGVLAGALGKMARDIILLAQTEVGEVYEPSTEGRGTSSTMPHKRNPILSTAISANTQRIPFLVATLLSNMPQAHERDAGHWHAEWETMDTLLGLVGGVVEKSGELMSGLEVSRDRMLENLEKTRGLIYAENISFYLAKNMGKSVAHELMQKACLRVEKENITLLEALIDMKLDIDRETMTQLFHPEKSIARCVQLIEEILSDGS